MSWSAMTLPAALDRVVGPVRRATRYDVVLAVIPVAFLSALLLGSTPAVPGPAAVAVATVVGLLAVVDALFLNPPRDPTAGSPPA